MATDRGEITMQQSSTGHKFGISEALALAGVLVAGFLAAGTIVVHTAFHSRLPQKLRVVSLIAIISCNVAVFAYAGFQVNSVYRVVVPPPPPPPKYDWSFWSPVNEDFKLDKRDQQLTAVAVANDKLDVFAIGNDNQIWSAYWEGPSGWHDWYPLPHNDKFGPGLRRITTVSRPEIDKTDVFAIGDDNRLWWTWWQGRAWSEWQPLPGDARFDPRTQAISAVSRSQFNVDLFAVDLNGVVRTAFWDWVHNSWHSFYNVPAGPMTFPQSQNVSAVARNEHTLDAFIIGSDGAVWRTNYQDGRTWAQWEEVPGKPGFDPTSQQVAAVSRPGSDTLDILAIDGRDRVLSNHSDNGQDWQVWTQQIPDLGFDHSTQRLTALARSGTNVDVFAFRSDGPSPADGKLWSAWWNNRLQSWGKWFDPPLGGAKFDVAQQNIAAVARTQNNMDLFAIGEDGALWTAAWGIR